MQCSRKKQAFDAAEDECNEGDCGKKEGGSENDSHAEDESEGDEDALKR